MVHPRKQSQSDDTPGAPEWMVTFSDCMTLLLTFFVLLLSFSSFDENIFEKLKVIFSSSLSSSSITSKDNKDAFLPAAQFKYIEELNKGSEKPTLENGIQDNLKQETQPADFHNRKVFLVSSERIFWGRGAVISRQGCKILDIVGAFLKEVPTRVVISENTWGRHQNSTSDASRYNQSGLERAWAVLEYLTTAQGLDKKSFSISAAGTVAQKGLKGDELSHSESNNKRMLEIVLLERSICN